MVIEYKVQIKAVLQARVVKNRMLWNYGIDVHRRLSRLLTRSSRCYKAQYVPNLVSSLYQSRRALYVLILPILIYRISVMQSIDFRGPDFNHNILTLLYVYVVLISQGACDMISLSRVLGMMETSDVSRPCIGFKEQRKPGEVT